MDVVDDAVEQAVTRFDTMPWVEKYRPKSLTELIAHEEIIQILNKLIESNKLPHLLFYGPPGTGNGWHVSFVFSCCIITLSLVCRQNFHYYGLCEENVRRALFFHDPRAQCIRR